MEFERKNYDHLKLKTDEPATRVDEAYATISTSN